MQKKKKEYVAPDITVTQVEVESALCGSANMEAQSPAGGAQSNAQEVNKTFGSAAGDPNYFGETDSWNTFDN